MVRWGCQGSRKAAPGGGTQQPAEPEGLNKCGSSSPSHPFFFFLKNIFYSLHFQGFLHSNKSCFMYPPPQKKNVIGFCHHLPPGPGSSRKLKILQILGQTTRADATALQHTAKISQAPSAPPELRSDEEKHFFLSRQKCRNLTRKKRAVFSAHGAQTWSLRHIDK